MNTGGIEPSLANLLTQTFAAPLAPTGDAHAYAQIRAIHGSDIGTQGGENAFNTLILGMGAEVGRGVASESSAPDAHIDRPMAALDMRTTSNRGLELASSPFLPFLRSI